MEMKRAALAGLLALSTLAASGCTGRSPKEPSDRADATVSATTDKAAGEAGPIKWAIYRATSSLDPIKAFDIPETAVITAMCETLLVQQPDFSLTPGLATSAEYVSPTSLVLQLDKRATFWDGSPVTAEDVAFSLERVRDPKAGGFFTTDFARVQTISVTAEDQVTISFSEPDYWLRGVLSAMPGIVVQKKFAELAGADLGTPSTGVMCSGPFKFSSWSSGGDVVVDRNDSYWKEDAKAMVPSVTFRPVSNDANLAAAFSTGDLNGYYVAGSSVYDELSASGKVKATSGPSLTTDLLAIGDPSGPMGNEKLRQAVSLAVDRSAYINQVYSGQATVPTSVSSSSTWGYGKQVFEDELGKAEPLKQDIEKAKSLVAETGMQGKTIKMVVASGLVTGQIMAAVLKEALENIGLKLELQTISLDKYNELFFDPAARTGVDVFVTVNNPIAPDPAPLLASIGTPDGAYNFSGWSNSEVVKLLDQSRITADENERARLVAEADKLITSGLPQIPMAHPYNVLYLDNTLSGAPASYSFAAGPWANFIGKAAK